MSIWVNKGMVSTHDLGADDIPDGEYMTSKEYAEAYHVKPGTVRQWRNRGQLDSYILLDGTVMLRVGDVPKRRCGNAASHGVTKKVSQK